MGLTDFGYAIRALKAGSMVTRKGWNGKGQFLLLKEPNASNVGAPTLPFVMIHTVQGDLVPWLASQSDMLAEDWDTCTLDYVEGREV